MKNLTPTMDQKVGVGQVMDEIQRHCEPDLSSPPFKTVPDPERRRFLENIRKRICLHPGEVTALGIAWYRPKCIFASDDLAARLAAKDLLLKVHGTLGLLLRSFRVGHKSKEEVIELIRSIPYRSTLHIKRQLLEKAESELKSCT